MPRALDQTIFACFDCEATGLNTEEDRIIEIGIALFKLGDPNNPIKTFETLVNPLRPIPKDSQEIHNISDEMVKDAPTIENVLPQALKMLKDYPLMGHSLSFDINLFCAEAQRCQIPCDIRNSTVIDTLRLARHYGQSPVNSLQALRSHFNIPEESAHRAMSDVLVYISVFSHLTRPFKSLDHMLSELSKPIELKNMPLGKHKGRPFKEIPVEYLRWAINKDFDIDLKFSIKQELKRRARGTQFNQSANPFQDLNPFS